MAVLLSPDDNLPELAQIYSFLFLLYCFFKNTPPPRGHYRTRVMFWRMEDLVPHEECCPVEPTHAAGRPPPTDVRLHAPHRPGQRGGEAAGELGLQLASQASFSQAKPVLSIPFRSSSLCVNVRYKVPINGLEPL